MKIKIVIIFLAISINTDGMHFSGSTVEPWLVIFTSGNEEIIQKLLFLCAQ